VPFLTKKDLKNTLAVESGVLFLTKFAGSPLVPEDLQWYGINTSNNVRAS
jgi:hypothetical protein